MLVVLSEKNLKEWNRRQHDFLIISYDLLAKAEDTLAAKDLHFGVVVLDESHYIKSPKVIPKITSCSCLCIITPLPYVVGQARSV